VPPARTASESSSRAGDHDRVYRIASNLVECAVRRAYAPSSNVVARSGPRGLTVSNTEIESVPSGTWLELVVARRVALAMGGDVSVDCDLVRGTTFTLRLPRAGEPARGGYTMVQA
jgi:hypothetical protein